MHERPSPLSDPLADSHGILIGWRPQHSAPSTSTTHGVKHNIVPPRTPPGAFRRLTKESRAKIITLITIDVHSRDVVQGLIDRRVESNLDFAWQSQLRYAACVVALSRSRLRVPSDTSLAL